MQVRKVWITYHIHRPIGPWPSSVVHSEISLLMYFLFNINIVWNVPYFKLHTYSLRLNINGFSCRKFLNISINWNHNIWFSTHIRQTPLILQVIAVDTARPWCWTRAGDWTQPLFYFISCKIFFFLLIHFLIRVVSWMHRCRCPWIVWRHIPNYRKCGKK